MATNGRLTDRLAYYQRMGGVGLPAAPPSKGASRLDLRRLLHVRGIGRVEKAAARPPLSVSDEPMWLPSTDLVIGLYGYKMPLAFLIANGPDGVAVHFGTWAHEQENKSEAVLESRQAVLRTVLRSLYSTIDLKVVEARLPRWP